MNIIFRAGLDSASKYQKEIVFKRASRSYHALLFFCSWKVSLENNAPWKIQ